MNDTFRKTISFILTLALLLGTAVVPVSAGPVPEDITVSTRMDPDVVSSGKQIYKLVVSVYSPTGLNTMATVMSYDNTVVVPVNQGTKADVTALDNGGVFAAPLKILLVDEGFSLYSSATRSSYINGSRTAFKCDISSTLPLTAMASEQDAFEFYFRIADGKTVADMNVGTFRVETDKAAGSFLSEIFTQPDVLSTHYGLMVYEPNATIHYYPAPGDVVLTLVYTNSDQLITPTVSAWPTPSAITYGDTLADSTLTGGEASVPGNFGWNGPETKPVVSDSGTRTYGVTFTPTDTAIYKTVPHPTGLTLAVNPLQVAAPTIKANGTYTGKTQTPDIDSRPYYNIAGSATNAGFYEDGVTVSLSDSANCIWAGGGTAPLTLDWIIDPAGYAVEVPTKEIKVGSPNSRLPGAVTTGVNGEKPVGQLTWYSSAVARDQDTPIPENFIPTTPLGNYTLWWKFVTADTNYVSTPKLGYTTITIINGDPQNIEITGKPSSAVYGMTNFTLGSVVTTTGGVPAAGHGTVTWSSSNESVATIDAATGVVDVLTAGTTTITASAAAVPGEYAAGSSTYELDVLQVPLTVGPGTYKVTKVYDGTVAPGTGSGDLAVTGILAGDEADVTVSAIPQAYTSKNVVGDTEVAATLSLSGAKSGNYTLTSGTIDVPCSITPRSITGVSVTSVTKTYDGTTEVGDATINGAPMLTGKVEGDDLKIGLTATSFNDANVATAGKTASITLGALSGTDAPNYSLAAASPITATAYIVPADIIGYSTMAPTATIIANDANNTGAASLKANSIVLPANVTVTYGAGTASLPIVWAGAEEAYNAKGGTYTYKGTVTNDANFNFYTTTLDAVLTVTPVTITGIEPEFGYPTVAKSTVMGAVSLMDPAIGLPAQMTLSFDNSVADLVVDSTWDKTLDDLKTLAGEVTKDIGQSITIMLTDVNFPAWATLGVDMPFRNLTIIDKFDIPAEDITFNDAIITFGDVLGQTATVDPATYPGAAASYLYWGSEYDFSETPPVNAGTYNVMATVENDTHRGTKLASLTINPKTLTAGAIGLIPNQTYTGSALRPSLTVTDGLIPLVLNTDYTAAYSANTAAGTASVTVTGIGNYTGSASKTFTILPKSIAGATITADDQTYTGGLLTPAYMVKDGDTTLVLGTDYTLTDYTGNTNVGTAVISIAGTGNYTGTATGQFGITKADYDMSGIDFDDASKEYNGTAQSIAITGTLPTGSDAIQVTVSYSGSATNVSESPATITATFATSSVNYNVPEAMTAELAITPKAIASDAIGAIADQTYTGSAITPALTVLDGITPLVSGTDYTTEYSSNTNVGTGTVTITGIGNYTGTTNANFTINKADYNMSGIGFADASKAYTGSAQSIGITGTLPTGADAIPVTVSYSGSATNVSDSGATITATFATTSGNYNVPAPMTADLTILPKNIATATVTAADQSYDGTAKEPAFTVKDGGTDLVLNTEYTFTSYASNTNAGTADINIAGTGNYTGTVTGHFTISKTTSDIAFSNTSQTLTSAGNNITDVTATLTPASAGATATVYYWVVVMPGADPSLDVYGWDTTVPQTAGTYKIYASTAGDANLNPVNAVAPDESAVTDTLVINPYRASGGGGGGTVTPPAVVNPPVTTGTTTTVTTTVTPVTTGTTSTATVTAQNMNNAVNAVVGASASGGTATNVEIQVNAPQGASEVQVVLPTASVNNLLAQGTTPSLTVTSGVAQVTFDEAALEAITEGAQGQDITIVAKEVDAEVLSDEEKALVGDRPVLDLVVMSGGKVISDFKGGNATVSIPYTLGAGETAQGLTIWFMTDEGQLTEMPCTYDAVTGMVTFTTGHFSNYVLGYFPFVDMADSAWYYENGVYAYTNNLISGVSSDRFDPLGKTTRAMVVTILWRLDGKPAAAPNGFKDVPASWHSDAVSWASANGIASGYSSEKFGPNDPITREQMSAIIYNYGVYKGYDMTGRKDLSTFADNAKVSAWAQNSMQWAVEKGIISGTGTGKLDPAGSAQRAQVAAILQRFIENIK